MNIIVDDIRNAKTQRNSWIAIAKIKEGEIDGVDCRPEMSAQECREIANDWLYDLRRLEEQAKRLGL